MKESLITCGKADEDGDEDIDEQEQELIKMGIKLRMKRFISMMSEPLVNLRLINRHGHTLITITMMISMINRNAAQNASCRQLS